MSELQGIDWTTSAEKLAFDAHVRDVAYPYTSTIERGVGLFLQSQFEPGTPSRFYHERIGPDGEPWLLPKTRTMRGEDDPTNNGISKLSPRIVPWGRLIRDIGLDELPQIGELGPRLSLIGPRSLDQNTLDNFMWLGRKVDPGLVTEWHDAIYCNPKIRQGIDGPGQLSWAWHNIRTGEVVAKIMERELGHYLVTANERNERLMIARTPLVLVASALWKHAKIDRALQRTKAAVSERKAAKNSIAN